MTQRDKQIVRELAKRYMELAASDVQQEMNRRMRATNDLQLVRPPVLIDEIPWYQMNFDDELTCLCEDEDARGVEYDLRRALYRRKFFRADTLFEPFWRVRRHVESTDNGLSPKETVIHEDKQNNIYSHAFHDVLADEEALDRLHKKPIHRLRPDLDESAMAFYTDLFGEAMPVKLCGENYFGFPVWDRIGRLRGMTPMLLDLYDRPEYTHRILQTLVADAQDYLDFIEQNSVVDNDPVNLHCTPGMISGLADSGWKATWFRGTAQTFTSVSPEMFEEFEINYVAPIAERFAYTYYGCCEPLDTRFDVISKLPHLRKLGVSPWANEAVMAERIGGNYVYSRKPNPALVAHETDPEVVRKETEETVKLCIRHGCPCEFVLKDISNVSHRPQNLIVWAQTVSDVLDAYYGK